MIDWDGIVTIFLAIIAASLVEHLVIAPRMAHSPAKAGPAMPATPKTAADFIKLKFPNAVTV